MLLEFLYFIFAKCRQISSHTVFLPRSWEVLLGPSVRPVAAAAPSPPQVPLPGNQVSCDAQPSKPRYLLMLYTHMCRVKFKTFISASSLVCLKESRRHLHYQRQGQERDPLRPDVLQETVPPPPFLLTLRDGTCLYPPAQDPDGPDGTLSDVHVSTPLLHLPTSATSLGRAPFRVHGEPRPGQQRLPMSLAGAS